MDARPESGCSAMTRIVFLMLAVLALTACPTGNDDYIRAKIDGKSIEFREDRNAIISGLDGRKETLTFYASVDGSQGTHSFEVDLELPGGQLATTRYSANRALASQPRSGFRLSDSLTAQYSPSTTGSFINDSGEHGASGDFVVEVTSLGTERVKGRFEGGLELDGKIIHVENGVFSLPYVYKKRNNPW